MISARGSVGGRFPNCSNNMTKSRALTLPSALISADMDGPGVGVAYGTELVAASWAPMSGRVSRLVPKKSVVVPVKVPVLIAGEFTASL